LVKPRLAHEFILFAVENAIKGGTKSEKRKLPKNFLLLHETELKESYAIKLQVMSGKISTFNTIIK